MNQLQFHQYKIEKELGRGGMGVVYLALDKKLNRRVALKVLLPHATEKHSKRFMQEAHAIARLNHPNIIKIFNVGEEPQVHYTMEYIHGQTLSFHIYEDKLSIDEIVQLFIKIAKALDVAHKKGIIHRDLKPSNIMLDTQKTPIVMDFGLAKLEESNLSQTTDVLGTPAYMPPEQFRHLKVDARSDVYSLGACLYECLAKQRIFGNGSTVNIMFQALNKDPIPPRSIVPHIPVDLQAICLKCLEKSPRKRYSSAKLLATDLENFSQNKKILARPITKWGSFVKLIQRNKFISSVILFLIALTLLYVVHLQSANAKLHQAKTNADYEKTKAENERKKAEDLAGKIKGANIKLENVLYEQNVRLLDQAYQNSNIEMCHVLLKKIQKQKDKVRKYHSLETSLYQNLLTEHIVYQVQIKGGISDCDVYNNIVAVCSNTGILSLFRWNGERLILIKEIVNKNKQGTLDSIRRVAFLPDGSHIVICDKSRQVKILDTRTLRFREIMSNFATATSLKTSKDFVVTADHLAMQIWGIQSEKTTRHDYSVGLQLRVHKKGGLYDLDFADDKIAVIGSKPEIELFLFQGNKWLKKIIKTNDSAPSVCAWLSNSELVCGYKSGDISIWNLALNKKTQTFQDENLFFYGKSLQKAHEQQIDTIAISPSGEIVSSANNTMKIWRKDPKAQQYKMMHKLEGHNKKISAISFLNDKIISCSTEGNIFVWDLKYKLRKPVVRISQQIKRIAISQPQKLHVYGRLEYKIFDLENTEEAYPIPRYYIGRHALSRDMKILALNSPKVVKLYSALNGKKLFSLIDEDTAPLTHTGRVESMHFGKQYFFTSGPKIIKGWDVNSGKRVKKYVVSANTPDNIRFVGSFKDKIFASIGRVIFLFDHDSQKDLGNYILQQHPMDFKVTPNEEILVTYSGHDMHAYDIENGNLLAELSSHTNDITDIVITKDNKRLISCGLDKNICIWDIEDLLEEKMETKKILPLIKMRNQHEPKSLALRYDDIGNVSAILFVQQKEVIMWKIR